MTGRPLTALVALVLAAACGQTEPVGLAPRSVPDLDPRDERTCYDPGVEGSYRDALAENRLALADCRLRHANVVEAYLQVMERVPAPD
ncbi:MAG: hypothetical protein LC676_08880 [Loktanella sp.]|nr:hypothetical protein [Loktanella sp.]